MHRLAVALIFLNILVQLICELVNHAVEQLDLSVLLVFQFAVALFELCAELSEAFPAYAHLLFEFDGAMRPVVRVRADVSGEFAVSTEGTSTVETGENFLWT